MSETQLQLQGLKEAWDLCKAHEDQKNSLINGLFAHIDDITGKLSESESELRDKKDIVNLMRTRVDDRDKQIQALQHEKAKLCFASVVIDGDCMPFKDVLVKEGLNGGKQAASLLKQAVEVELKSPGHVAVRVYANVRGLAKTYKEMEIANESVFDDFIRGFNMGDAMCDYVDAGNGKECSDEKVKATFRFHLGDVHCQRVLFGGSADNGYARMLEPYRLDGAVHEKIILLEGPPFAYELANIKDQFHTTSFDNVFRSQKLFNNKRRVSFHITPPLTPSVDYASAVAKGRSTPPPPTSVAQQSARTTTAPAEVQRNAAGERVDPFIPRIYSQQEFFELKGRKLCNNFHLARCHYMNCQHKHGETLSLREKAALRDIARLSPCTWGLYCSDPECLQGHRCTRDNCVRSTCRFTLEMHDVDTKIVA